MPAPRGGPAEAVFALGGRRAAGERGPFMALSAREKILKAAFREFARRGFAGTRVNTVATKARVNKQLIYYYFGSKQGLYEEVAREIHAEREAVIGRAPDAFADNLAYWLRRHADDPDYLRLLMWESLEAAKKPPGEESRRHFWAESIAQAKRNEAAGLWPDAGDTGHALLCWLGAVMFPLAFPQLTRLIAGKAPDDATFLAEREAFLRAWAGRQIGR